MKAYGFFDGFDEEPMFHTKKEHFESMKKAFHIIYHDDIQYAYEPGWYLFEMKKGKFIKRLSNEPV